MSDDLTKRQCRDLPKGSPALGAGEIAALMPRLDPGWHAGGGKLTRRFEVKGYAPAHMLANATAFLAEREGHHPDISFGWGWCEVTFWTHTVGGLSENDFICAAKLDALVAG
ncbi:4a-hydroxytetrahydrobiopterin dehydratase [Sinisalibacter aestuarii]|uniref:4a-hydroxytetrahydrobiopterin dehydratase n=1 Tax=Sinisalibacter aestuarii TaxID=2949426 RepID=A0ABQ5LSZ8_9RHOB|nr:4a-hydroxytetrahydrobiopterin dehydratase [Sinisalibacter aestuarii]GKY87868.1 putative pterin-4-alpha-carbinolamine dehydratase [Sinisalibacter aestuarii]